MVGSRIGHARRDHVRVADGLDLLEAVALGERVELAEQSIEQPDDLGRRQSVRAWREVDDVGEQHRGRLELIGDRLGRVLQPLGDRAREDVQQQVLGSRLRDPQPGKRVLSLLREEREEREDDRPAHGDVQRQHQAREPLGQRRSAADEDRREAGAEEEGEPHDEPADARADAAEHQCPERRHDAPQADAARRQPAADRRIIDRVGAMAMASSWMFSSMPKSRVRANTAIDATETMA